MANFQLEVTTNLPEVFADVSRQVVGGWRRQFEALLVDFHQRFRATRLSGRPGLIKRTGALDRSFYKRVEGRTLNTMRATYYTTSIYARIHEYGGIIRAKRKKALTIPIGRNAIVGGRRIPASRFKNTYVKNGIIYQNRNGLDVPLFILRKQVKIPPRLGLREEWRKFQPLIVDKLKATSQRALNKAAKKKNRRL